MLLVIPTSRHDLPLALLNARLAHKLDERCPPDVACLVSAPHGVDITELLALLREWCSDEQLLQHRYDDWTGDAQWPRPQNWAWQCTARHIAALRPPRAWLWWEADATPLRPGWLMMLRDAHMRGGKPFSGHIVNGKGNGHMNGVAIYPPDVRPYSSNAFIARSAPFDRVLSESIVPRHVHPLNDLIGHYLKPVGRASMPIESVSDARSIIVGPHALWHGSSDGALARYLLDPSSLSAHATPPHIRRMAISLLCFNKLELTRRCLESLEASTPLPYTLTVTDNASTDGTREFLQAFASVRPHVRIVTNASNLGYKEPHDNAFAHCLSREPTPELFVILNNDVELGEGWVERANRAFDKDTLLAIVGNTGVCCNLTPTLNGVHAIMGKPPEYIEGSLLIAHVNYIALLGGPLFARELDFIYCEDCDLSLRARERGFGIATVDLNCRHLYSQTVTTLDAVTKARIARALEDNLAWMRKRWAVYAKRRDFHYQVLVTRRHAFGDVIDVTPIVAAIKRKWPMCEVDVHTDFPDVFRSNPCVRAAQQAPFTRRYDFVFNLDKVYELLPHLHTLEAYSRVCDVECSLDTMVPALYAAPSDTRTAMELFPRRAGEKWCIAHCGPTGWPGKDWSMERWVELVERLHREGWMVCVVGNGEGIVNADRDVRKKTSAQVLYELMKRGDVFVGLDSGPSHVAQAALLPAVVLFGTVLAERKLFRACPVVGVQASVNDVPCVGEHHRLPPPVERSVCGGECMKAISVEMVMDAVDLIAKGV